MERFLGNFSPVVNKQIGTVALLQGVPGNPFSGQEVAVFLDIDPIYHPGIKVSLEPQGSKLFS